METSSKHSHRAVSRVLITGGGGYIGTGLATRLAIQGWKVTRIVRRSFSPLQVSGANVVDVIADLSDPMTWLHHALENQVIVHLAAQTSTSEANDDALSDQEVNVRPMIHLLEACRQHARCPIIVFASTATVVGVPRTLPVTEDSPHEPVTVYDVHKWMAEEYLKLYVRLGHVRGAALRLTNVYGPGPVSRRTDRGILNAMVRKALDGECLKIFGTGDWVRDYVYVDDVIEAFVAAVNNSGTINGRHWMIGSGQGHTVREAFQLVADRVAQYTGRRVPVEYVPFPSTPTPIEERNFIADIGGFSRATGWSPTLTLQEGIDRTIETLLLGPK